MWCSTARGPGFDSPVRELRSHKLRDVAKRKKKKVGGEERKRNEITVKSSWKFEQINI